MHENAKTLGELHDDIDGKPSPYAKEYMQYISEDRNAMFDAKYALERLTSQHDFSNPSLLRELFPDYEIRQNDFPDVQDFINQQPRHAFCRKERADNVTLFRTLPAPDPNPAVKAVTIREMENRYTERKQQRQELPQEKKEQPQASPLSTNSGQAAAAPPPVEEIITAAANEEEREQPVTNGDIPHRIRRRRARRAKEKAAKANGAAVDEEIDF